jgi:hypothetical protein
MAEDANTILEALGPPQEKRAILEGIRTAYQDDRNAGRQ